jgi:hypothetical protein
MGMLLGPSTDICLKELAGDVRGFFNSLLNRELFPNHRKGPKAE